VFICGSFWIIGEESSAATHASLQLPAKLANYEGVRRRSFTPTPPRGGEAGIPSVYRWTRGEDPLSIFAGKDSIGVEGIREMTVKRLRFGVGFSVALGNQRAQAATMVLAPGRKRRSLRAGTLLLIERGTTHEIRNTGKSSLKTLNLYVPPAYTSKGDPLPRGRK
jgi:hypothetical protein